MNKKYKLLIVVMTVSMIVMVALGLAYLQFTEQQTELAELKSKLNYAEKNNATLRSDLRNAERALMKRSKPLSSLSFIRREPEHYTIGRDKYKLTKFHTTSLFIGKNGFARGSSYLELYNNALILISATGIFSYVDLEALKQEKFEMTVIPSNISEIVRYDDFFQTSSFGIKDALILENNLYVSFSNELKPDCFNTSILVAEMNMSSLVFRNFFQPKKCIKRENDLRKFNAHRSGGRMVPYKASRLLFTIGEYGHSDKAQNLDNPFGKAIAIDLETGEYEIISMGLRDAQGLHYSDKEDTIYITDHGPQGGDEINILKSPGSNVANFGWPISSYGEHYGFAKRDDKARIYRKAPLYKSHSDHGFTEPVIHFVPSIAISEIEQIPEEFNGADLKQFIIGSMGNEPLEGDMALHLVQFGKENNFITRDIIPLKERVRDMLYSHELAKVIMFLETSPAIGILEANY